MNGLSIIIPSKTLSNLSVCLNGIRNNGETCRVIVVDDFDVPGAVKSEPADNIEVVVGKRPFIFSRNINIGIAAAGTDDVVLLNDDAILKSPRGFSRLQEAAYAHPEYGIIASTCNNVGNRNQWPKSQGLRDDPRQLCFVCVFIPRTTIDKVGMLDERFTAYGFEDDDYSLRVRQAGLRLGILDGVEVDHGSLKSTFRGDPGRSAQLGDGRAIFIEKWGSYPL